MNILALFAALISILSFLDEIRYKNRILYLILLGLMSSVSLFRVFVDIVNVMMFSKGSLSKKLKKSLYTLVLGEYFETFEFKRKLRGGSIYCNPFENKPVKCMHNYCIREVKALTSLSDPRSLIRSPLKNWTDCKTNLKETSFVRRLIYKIEKSSDMELVKLIKMSSLLLESSRGGIGYPESTILSYIGVDNENEMEFQYLSEHKESSLIKILMLLDGAIDKKLDFDYMLEMQYKKMVIRVEGDKKAANVLFKYKGIDSYNKDIRYNPERIVHILDIFDEVVKNDRFCCFVCDKNLSFGETFSSEYVLGHCLSPYEIIEKIDNGCVFDLILNKNPGIIFEGTDGNKNKDDLKSEVLKMADLLLEVVYREDFKDFINWLIDHRFSRNAKFKSFSREKRDDFLFKLKGSVLNNGKRGSKGLEFGLNWQCKRFKVDASYYLECMGLCALSFVDKSINPCTEVLARYPKDKIAKFEGLKPILCCKPDIRVEKFLKNLSIKEGNLQIYKLFKELKDSVPESIKPLISKYLDIKGKDSRTALKSMKPDNNNSTVKLFVSFSSLGSVTEKSKKKKKENLGQVIEREEMEDKIPLRFFKSTGYFLENVKDKKMTGLQELKKTWVEVMKTDPEDSCRLKREAFENNKKYLEQIRARIKIKLEESDLVKRGDDGDRQGKDIYVPPPPPPPKNKDGEWEVPNRKRRFKQKVENESSVIETKRILCPESISRIAFPFNLLNKEKSEKIFTKIAENDKSVKKTKEMSSITESMEKKRRKEGKSYYFKNGSKVYVKGDKILEPRLNKNQRINETQLEVAMSAFNEEKNSPTLPLILVGDSCNSILKDTYKSLKYLYYVKNKNKNKNKYKNKNADGQKSEIKGDKYNISYRNYFIDIKSRRGKRKFRSTHFSEAGILYEYFPEISMKEISKKMNQNWQSKKPKTTKIRAAKFRSGSINLRVKSDKLDQVFLDFLAEGGFKSHKVYRSVINKTSIFTWDLFRESGGQPVNDEDIVYKGKTIFSHGKYKKYKNACEKLINN